jgi:hypothetical protein
MTPTDSANKGPHGASRYDDGVPHHQPGIHDEMHNVDVAHEHIDVDLRGLALSAGALVAVVIVSQLAMYGLFLMFAKEATANDPAVSPVAFPAAQVPHTTAESPRFSVGAQGPPLVTNEPMVLQEHRTEEQKRLHTYGWIDEKSGVAYIPIEEAKRLILERGLLPVRAGAAVPQFAVQPPARGEASGGRATAPQPAPVPAPVPAVAPVPAPTTKPHSGGQ